MMMMQQQVRFFLSGLIVVSLFFWAWAVKNTAAAKDGMIDLGIVSFGMVVVTSSYVLGMVNGNSNSGMMVPPKKSVGGILFLVSPLLVAINYGAGAILGFGYLNRPGFGMYCVLFVFLWLVTAWYAHELLKKASISSSGPTSSVVAGGGGAATAAAN
jgi:hypothetical protein